MSPVVVAAALLTFAPPTQASDAAPPERGSGLIVGGATLAYGSAVLVLAAPTGNGTSPRAQAVFAGTAAGLVGAAAMVAGGVKLRIASQAWYRERPDFPRATGTGLIVGGVGALAMSGFLFGFEPESTLALTTGSIVGTAGLSLVTAGAVVRHRWRVAGRSVQVGASPTVGGGAFTLSGQF